MTFRPFRSNGEVENNNNGSIRLLLISNMYPGKHHLFFGAFIRNIEKGLVENGVEVDRIVIADKSRNVFEKIWKYTVFYLKIFIARFSRYDIVQLSYPSHTYLPFLFRKLKNTIFVVRLHGLDLLGAEQESWTHLCLTRIFSGPALRRADLVVVPSHYFLEELNKRFTVRDTFVYPSGGVDLTLFHPTRKPSDFPTVGYVGRLDKFKGVDILLKAIALAETEIRLLIVGDGSLTEKYKDMARKLEIEGQILFKGAVSQQHLASEYNAMDLLAFPTMRKAESFGNVAIEAMACSVPVAGSRIAGLYEYMADDENGYFVPSGDPKALAEVLDRFFRLSPEKVKQMKTAALETARKFERNLVSRGYVERLDRMLSDRKQGKMAPASSGE
ncbi:MAG: glycosyltransferase family 4 protein [Acidobacteria bacterium]|nr:glycosyltransferase family 4 protein [Acidobacteriota bacterium]